MKTGLIALVLVLSACGGGVVATSSQQAFDLAGPDLDGNGIRDDVDAFIAKSYSVPAQRKAAAQLAGVLQSELLVDTSDRVALLAIPIKSSKAINCIFNKFTGVNGGSDPSAVAKNLESITMNTKIRILKYLSYAKALDGAVFTQQTGETCE